MSLRLSSTQIAAITLGVLAVALIAVVWRTVPWSAGEAGGRGQLAAHADFSTAEVDRETKFHRQLRPFSLGALAVTLVIAALLGFTPLGPRLIELVSRPLGGSWPVRALLGGLAVSVVAELVTLPLLAAAEVVLRRYKLSTQNWSGWFIDLGKSWLIGAVLASLGFLAFYAIVRVAPRWWWVAMSLLAAGLIFALSFLYPVLIEPVFNKFTPMQNTALRHDLMEMAQRDGVPVKEVLVADASRRTNALNAYVSGYGASRRIVVYDTLLRDAPDSEVKVVVAHELGHAKRNDVLVGTAIGAGGAAAAVLSLFLLSQWPALLRRAGVESISDPRSAALVLALIAIAGLVMAPTQGLISRRIEARADQHSLELTGDPTTFIAMHRRLATKNLSDLKPNPILYAMFASHPSTTLRLGHARDYAKRHDIELSPQAKPETGQ